MTGIYLVVTGLQVTGDSNNLLFSAIVLNVVSNTNPFHNEMYIGYHTFQELERLFFILSHP